MGCQVISSRSIWRGECDFIKTQVEADLREFRDHRMIDWSEMVECDFPQEMLDERKKVRGVFFEF